MIKASPTTERRTASFSCVCHAQRRRCGDGRLCHYYGRLDDPSQVRFRRNRTRWNPDDASTRACSIAAAKVYIGEAGRPVGQVAVQLHGGMGVVDEHIVGHYFQRLTMIDLTFGDADYHLGRFSDSLIGSSFPA